MNAIFAKVGGRKFFLLIVVLILTALKEVLGIDDETINKLVLLAIGGSGAIALEDGLSKVIHKPKPK